MTKSSARRTWSAAAVPLDHPCWAITLAGRSREARIGNVTKRWPSGHEPAVMAKLVRHRGAFPMTIIDSQVHAYEANTPKRPWHSVPNWPAHVTGDEMVAAIDKVGVDGAIFISALDRK